MKGAGIDSECFCRKRSCETQEGPDGLLAGNRFVQQRRNDLLPVFVWYGQVMRHRCAVLFAGLATQSACALHYGGGARLSADTDGRIGLQAVGSVGIGEGKSDVDGALGLQGGIGYLSGPSDLFFTVGPQASVAILDSEQMGINWRPGLALDITFHLASGLGVAPRAFLGVLRTSTYDEDINEDECGSYGEICLSDYTYGLLGYEIGYALFVAFDDFHDLNEAHVAHRLSTAALYEVWKTTQ